MPGLIRGMARTAVIAGTATAVSNGVSRRQHGRWEQKAQQQAAQPQQQPQQAPQPPPAPAPAPATDFDAKIEQLKKLGELYDNGVLTDDEFAAQKAKLLG
jgi:hypothetical protein